MLETPFINYFPVNIAKNFYDSFFIEHLSGGCFCDLYILYIYIYIYYIYIYIYI